MKTWIEVEALVRKLLWDKYKVGDEYTGEAWLAYTKACETYDPLKAQFTTHLRHTVLGHFADYFRYNERLVAIPVLKQKDESHAYLSFDTPISADGSMTLEDTLTSEEATDTVLEATILDIMASLYPQVSKRLQRAIRAIKVHHQEGTKIPRSMRQDICDVKKIMYKKYLEQIA